MKIEGNQMRNLQIQRKIDCFYTFQLLLFESAIFKPLSLVLPETNVQDSPPVDLNGELQTATIKSIIKSIIDVSVVIVFAMIRGF